VSRRRSTAAALALALTVLVAVAGCGVPHSSNPVVVGEATPKGASNDRAPTPRQGPDRTIDAQELVRRYLRAAAGGNEVGQDPGAMDGAANFARSFFTAAARSTWSPGQDITVVRTRVSLPVVTPGGTRVDVSMQPIGRLNSHGTIEPGAESVAQPYQFTVVQADDGPGLRIANPPPGMLLSDEGLDSLYDVRPIYFWDTGNRTLVPDLRYITKSTSSVNRDVTLAGWLRDGPSAYLRQAVNPVPAAIEIKDRLVLDGSRLRVNLSAKAASVQPQLLKFVVQLRWTLRWLQGAVDLQIEGQRQDLSTNDALTYNPAAVADGQKDPPRFSVVDGQVRQLGGDPVRLPALNSDVNTSVVSAAILRGSAQQVALVRQDGAGRVRLWLGAYRANIPQYGGTDLVAGTMSRPVWLAEPSPRVLVAANGRLYDVPFEGRQPVDETPPGIRAVTAVSVAPDGRRLALVADGRAYVGVVQNDQRSVSVTQVQEVRTGLSDVTGIAWSREEWVVVAGRAGQSALVEATIDSALIEPLQLRNVPGPTVTRVAALPAVRAADPPRGERGLILLEANGRSYNVFSASVEEVSPEPPAPIPTPSTTPAKQPVPTSPFFLD
jgi:hypothetical protein